MARLDQLLAQDGRAKVKGDDEEAYSLSSTLVDELYEQVSAQIKSKKVKQQIKQAKQVVNVPTTHPKLAKKKEVTKTDKTNKTARILYHYHNAQLIECWDAW